MCIFKNKAFQDDGVCNRGDLKLIGLIDSIDQHSIRINERRDVDRYLIIYRKVLQIHLHYTKQRKWLHNIIHEKLANLHLLRIYRKTKWRSWPLSMHICGVIHLYHSWCDLQIPLGLVNWKIQMPWNPKSKQ